MVIHGMGQDYSVIYRRQTEQDFEILICEGTDRPFTLLRFYKVEDIHWLLEQSLSEQEISGNFEDYKGSFLWQDSLIMVFTRRDGMVLAQWLDGENPTLKERLEAGRHLLERLLLLNMPEYLLGSILNEQCILVTEQQTIVLHYEPEVLIGKDREPEQLLQSLFYQIFFRLFQEEAGEQSCKEISDFLEQMRKEPYQDIFHIYQCYDWLLDSMAGKADSIRRPPGWKERLNRLEEGLKDTGERMLIPVLLVAGMAVLIYGICHPEKEEAEEFLFEQIGTLEIQER